MLYLITLGGNISLFGFLEVFHVWKPFFWIFRKKNFPVAQIYKCLFFFKIKIVLLKFFWNDTSCIFLNIQNNNKKIPKIFSVFGGTSLNTLKLFLTKCFIIFYQSTWIMYFLSFQKSLDNILLVLSKKVIFTERHLNICFTTMFFLDENKKKKFSDMKK